MISIIVPSRNRPHELRSALASLNLAQHGLEALVWLDDDDPQLATYKTLFDADPNIRLFIKPRVGYKDIHLMHNFLAGQAKFDWILGYSDDTYFDNPDWFSVVANFLKQFDPAKQPIDINIWDPDENRYNLFFFVSRKYIELVGHIALFYAADTWVNEVAKGAGIVYGLQGVNPKHKKYTSENPLKDTTYAEVEKERQQLKHIHNPQRSPYKDQIQEDIRKIVAYNTSTMTDYELSILIPSRNEMFLARTIEDILKNIEANTEIIAVFDGAWADPAIPQHERVNVIYVPQSIGQRAATNLACKLSRATYVMKLDAHCSFDKGFDRKMLEAFKKTGDDITMVPIMRNLWAFDWKCMKCGKKWYQGPTPTTCQETNVRNTGKPCDSTKFTRKMMWIGKHNPQSTSYCFDSTPHFQYFEDWKHRPQYGKDKKETGLTETMSLQGSCWMLTRKRYWELDICDERFGGWGSQGIEVAVKSWLSGGRVLVNHTTWYAHMFRTQGGDFGFPYEISGKDQKKAQEYARNLFFNNNWPLQKQPLSWLIEKFLPVRGWTEEDVRKLKNNTFRFQDVAPVHSVEAEPRTVSEADSYRGEPQANTSSVQRFPITGVIYYAKI